MSTRPTHQGIGQQLLWQAEQVARQQHCDGLLVKAQKDTAGFFLVQGMQRLADDETGREYPNRFWKRTGNT